MGKRSRRGGTVGNEWRRGCPCCVSGNKKEDRRHFFGALRQSFLNKKGDIVGEECLPPEEDDEYIDFHIDASYQADWAAFKGETIPDDLMACAKIGYIYRDKE